MSERSRTTTILSILALTGASVFGSACGDDPDTEPSPDTPPATDLLVPLDPDVPDGVDTPVEADLPDDQNFDSPQPDFED